VTPSLLAVFAHPDDESLACGGLLALCADRGARVSLLCLTRGEHGPGGEPTRLGDTRARELDAAAHVLGVDEVVLLEHEDGMLPWIDAAKLEADIRSAIRRVAPDVVVTFDADGLYGHPDHIAVHERTTAAVAEMGGEAPNLLYVSMQPGAMRAVVEAAGARGPAVESTAAGRDAAAKPTATVLGIADPDAFGAMAPPPTLSIDVGRFATRKLQALRRHRSQVAQGVFDVLDEGDAPRVLGREHYRHASVGARGQTFVDALPESTSPAGPS